ATALTQGSYAAAAEPNRRRVRAAGETQDPLRRATALLFDSLDETPHTYRALLEARASAPAVREMWHAGRAEFASVIAGMVETERAAGRAPDGPPAAAIASVLLDLNDHAVERHSLGSGPPREEHIAAITYIWLSTIYGG